MHPPLINNVSQILNLGHAKSALLQIGTQLVLPQCLEDFSDVVEMLFPSLAEDKNVIQVYHYKWVSEWTQDVVHQPHEGCRSICQSERHDEPFKKALLGFEGSLSHIKGLDWYLVIPGLQVDLAEIFSPPWVGREGNQFVGSGNYSRKWYCSTLDSQYKVSKSHPSSTPTPSGSHGMLNLAR